MRLEARGRQQTQHALHRLQGQHQRAVRPGAAVREDGQGEGVHAAQAGQHAPVGPHPHGPGRQGHLPGHQPPQRRLQGGIVRRPAGVHLVRQLRHQVRLAQRRVQGGLLPRARLGALGLGRGGPLAGGAAGGGCGGAAPRCHVPHVDLYVARGRRGATLLVRLVAGIVRAAAAKSRARQVGSVVLLIRRGADPAVIIGRALPVASFLPPCCPRAGSAATRSSGVYHCVLPFVLHMLQRRTGRP